MLAVSSLPAESFLFLFFNMFNVLTEASSYCPIGLANTLYKLWTRLITNTLYEYAVASSILSTTQAGFCKRKDPIHQLENVIAALEDAKLFHKDIYALIVDFTSAFNTTDHDRMLWIMYDLVSRLTP